MQAKRSPPYHQVVKDLYGKMNHPIPTQQNKMKISCFISQWCIPRGPRLIHQRSQRNRNPVRTLATRCLAQFRAVENEIRQYTFSSPRSEFPLPTSIYIHVPFCIQRCYYCDFAITAVGNQPENPMLQSRYDTYVEHLLQEMELTLSGIRDRASHVESWPPLRTLYFGGGTPSLLPILYYEKIFEFLKRNFEFAPDIEITMEMDPGTFGTPEAKNFKELGMTRVSVGVQSFNDDLLKRCGRYHSVRDVYAAVDSLRGAGIYDIGLDLISGLPNQTLELWAQSLKCLIDLKPMHASTYDLEVHPSTKFGKMYKPGSFPLPDESLAAYMYETSIYTLNTAGISHYETSNFAVQGKESEHNQVYWRNEPYYGFGMSAASYVENKRVTRPRSLRAYYAWVEEHAQTNGSPDVIPCSFLEQVGDTLFLGLRQVKGLDLSVLERKANPQICENIKQASQPHIESGLVILENNVLRLHDPKGFLLENHIVSDLLVALEATK